MAVHFQAKSHVFFDGHVRIERVGLKHHRDTTFSGVYFGHVTRSDFDFAIGGLFKPSDHPQQGGLAAARWTHKNTKLAFIDVQIDVMDNLHWTVFFYGFGKCDAGHSDSPPISSETANSRQPPRYWLLFLRVRP